jgi:hypothetical protein
MRTEPKELFGEENLKDLRKRLDYKPLFRVKRVVLESIKNDCTTSEILKKQGTHLKEGQK